ncbi:MAG: hypothetical protein QG622_2925 [Actinomycetota bacterium]|nr:hypothetical protein [Actinomycetota bacterium]
MSMMEEIWRSAVQRPDPHLARVYAYLLGSKDGFAADRELAEKLKKTAPWIVGSVRANRAFLLDSVRRLAEEGVTQFLEIGSGLPVDPNVHDVVHAVRPDARVVYVDNDDVVLANARALMAPDDRVSVIKGDLWSPREILEDVAELPGIDLDRPVALLLVAILHFVTDDVSAAAIVATFAADLCPGSYIVISQTSAENDARGRATREAAAEYSAAVTPFRVRDKAQVGALFGPCELIPPGLERLTYQGRPVTIVAGIARTTGQPHGDDEHHR